MKQSIKYGIIAGLIFGILDIIPMFFMENFADKNLAILGAFINRFTIGFFIFNTNFLSKSWIKGVIVGLLTSLPDALITKAYAPIIGMGMIGGLIIGIIEQRIKNNSETNHKT